MQHEYDKFLNIVEEGGFNDAADKMHITQPALSIALKNLEKELGAQLLYRSAKGVKLTEAGAVVYKHAKIMRHTKKNLLSQLHEELKSATTLKVGAIDSISKVLVELQKTVLGASLELTVDYTNRLIDSLRVDRLDIAFTTRPKAKKTEDITLELLGEEKFDLVCVPQLKSRVKEDLKQSSTIYNFLSYDRHSNTHGLMQRNFTAAGIRVQGGFFSTSPDLIRLMALHGKGVALLPSSSVKQNLKNGTLVGVRGVKFMRPITSAILVGKYLSKDMEKLKNNVKKGLSNGT